ncbi:MAG: nucleotide triphosphate diphosphatase NUDT15 [Patescibacteria group bacterium]
MRKLPKVGVGVIIRKDNKVLLGLRTGHHGIGTHSLPGGHLEWNESIEQCAKRETLEETGLKIKNLRHSIYTNDIFKKEKKHYVTVFIVADYASGELKIKEPNREVNWRWYSWNKLPKPLFLPVKHLVEAGFNPFKNVRD